MSQGGSGLLDAALIAGIVAINAAIGFATEPGAERTIRSLTMLGRPPVPVRRDGAAWELAFEEIIPGDVLLLPAGTPVAADARIIAAQELAADEAALTGESVPVTKHSDAIVTPALPLAERANNKTGALTLNRMAVTAVLAGDKRFALRDGRYILAGIAVDPSPHAELIEILKVASLCNDSEIVPGTTTQVLNGSPTENALLVAAMAGDLDIIALRAAHPISTRISRSETRRFMMTVHEAANGTLLAVKGSPADVLALCRWRLRGGRRKRLT